jgi:hypothetical protein
MNYPKNLLAVGLLLSLSAATAQATLFDRGNGLIYDSDQNITWLKNANQGAGSSFDNGGSATDGLMTWQNAINWADSLVYQGYSDWRLPTTTDTGASGCDFAFSGTDCGYNVDPSTSELAYMFFTNLGNLSAFDTAGTFRGGSSGVDWGVVNSGPFMNLQNDAYWSGSEYAPNTNNAWNFNTNNGNQNANNKNNELYAWAVRPGE